MAQGKNLAPFAHPSLHHLIRIGFQPLPFVFIHCFVERYLLGKGELAPCRGPAFPAEATTVVTAPLAEAAIRAGMFLSLNLLVAGLAVTKNHILIIFV
jgi:hypothetical protein